APERQHALVAPVAVGDAAVVLERLVRGRERVLELVALPHVVAVADAAVVVLRVHGAADGPQRARLAVDPDDDALGSAHGLQPVDAPLGNPTCRVAALHGPDYTIVAVARAKDILKSPFVFLFQRPQKEELVAEYVIREHRGGRSLNDILEDA